MNKKNKALFFMLMLLPISGFVVLVVFFVKAFNALENHADIAKIVGPYTGGLLGVVIAFFLIYSIYRYLEYKEIRKLAYYSDEVQELANTSHFLLVVKTLFHHHSRQNKCFIVSVGIEKFEELRLATLTEEEIDDLLKTTSNFFYQNANLLKEKNTYASYEGDGVFNLYYERLNKESVISEFNARLTQLKELFKDKAYAPSLDFHAGICEIEDEDFTSTLKNAAIARFYNEKNNQTEILLYEPEMKIENREHMKMKGEIERGLANGEFEVYYQPKFNIKTNRFVGAEALIRWHHPEKGLLAPGAFIPFAEQNGLIVDIDRYVMEQVCKDIVSWKQNKTRLLLISINLSRNEVFKNDIVDFYKSMIDKYKVSPLLFEIEITESAVSKDMLYVINIIQQLKTMRFKTSMDDFGTGYSSLSYLKKMPVDTLKLDKSFFDEIEIDKRARDIVSTTIKLAKALEMNVIAEGIQTEKQVNFLKTTECDMIQGYYYSKPLPKVEYEAFLRKNKFE